MKTLNLLLVLFALLTIISCDNEDVDDIGQRTTTADLIAEESDLFALLNRVVTDDPDTSEITCIEFVYSFIVVEYDTDLQIVASQTVANDLEFSAFLLNVPDTHFVNISFPITSTLEDGTTFEVNNKEELETAIQQCREEQEEELIGQCFNILKDCVWEVALPDNVLFNTYTDAVFDNDSDGTTDMYYRGDEYNGTWIVYFIEDELHVNINLQGEGDVQDDWNFDWKTQILGDNTLAILNDDGVSFLLSKECEEENYCKTLDFEQCVVDGASVFTLSDYDECIIIIAAPQQFVDEVTGEVSPLVAWDIAYFETEVDATTGTNPITSDYTVAATTFVQTIYARIDNPDTGEFTIAAVNLITITCD